MSLATFRAAIIEASPLHFWTGVALATLGLAFVTWQGYTRFKHKRLMQNTPKSRIRSAAQGYVEFEGVAELLDGDPILAPLSGQTCTWYGCSIAGKEKVTNQRGQSSTRWRTLAQGVSDHQK